MAHPRKVHSFLVIEILVSKQKNNEKFFFPGDKLIPFCLKQYFICFFFIEGNFYLAKMDFIKVKNYHNKIWFFFHITKLWPNFFSQVLECKPSTIFHYTKGAPATAASTDSKLHIGANVQLRVLEQDTLDSVKVSPYSLS